MTCKDCIHFYVCINATIPNDEYKGELEDVLDTCIHFKNEADIAKVVRCKECGSYNKDYGECTLNGSRFGENGYCCKGTRTQNDFKEGVKQNDR